MTTPKFDKDRRGEVDIYLGESNEQVRESMRQMLRGEGYRKTRTFNRMEDLLGAITEAPPDVLIVADDLHANSFQIVKDIRSFKLGTNPFVMITMMVSGENDTNVKRAMVAGCDDIMIKPVSPGRMLDRIVHFTFNRTPFIVTTDYLGPERRKPTADRPSKIRQLIVVNTVKDKAEGKRTSAAELTRKVERCMTDVMASRLDSYGLKLIYHCNFVLKAYDEKKVEKEVRENLLISVSVLEEAAQIAKILGESKLAEVCIGLARQVEEVSEVYQTPTDAGMANLRQLSQAFAAAKAPLEARFSKNAAPAAAAPAAKPATAPQAAAPTPAPAPARVDPAAKGGDVTISADDLLK